MVMATAPSLFLFSSIQIGVHLALIMGAGKLLGIERKDVLLASNANVGGEHLHMQFICFICDSNLQNSWCPHWLRTSLTDRFYT